MPTIAAIINPYAGHGLAARVEPMLKRRLGGALEIVQLRPGLDAGVLARSYADHGYGRVLVLGGDGTFRTVAAAMLGQPAEVALIPAGHNNNIAASLGLPTDPERAIEVALGETVEWISAGRIDDYVFFEGAGIGLEASLFPIGEAMVRHEYRRLLEAPMLVAHSEAVEVDIELQSPTLHVRVYCVTMTISNSPMTGAHMKRAPGIDMRDPALYLTVYHDASRFAAMLHQYALMRGYRLPKRAVTRHPFMRATITSIHPLDVHADGSIIQTLPVTVESIPKAVRMAMPVSAPTAAAGPS